MLYAILKLFRKFLNNIKYKSIKNAKIVNKKNIESLYFDLDFSKESSSTLCEKIQPLNLYP